MTNKYCDTVSLKSGESHEKSSYFQVKSQVKTGTSHIKSTKSQIKTNKSNIKTGKSCGKSQEDRKTPSEVPIQDPSQVPREYRETSRQVPSQDQIKGNESHRRSFSLSFNLKSVCDTKSNTF